MGLLDFFKKTVKEVIIETSKVGTTNQTLPVSLSSTEEYQLNKLSQIAGIGNKLSDLYIENKRINANIQALRLQTNAVVTMHAKHIAATRELVTKVFAERAIGLNKHYEVLDQALASNDKELIIASLQGISSIVVSNPIEQIANFAAMLQSPEKKLVLDF